MKETRASWNLPRYNVLKAESLLDEYCIPMCENNEKIVKFYRNISL